MYVHDFYMLLFVSYRALYFFADPYNPGPGFFYPGQFPSFNDPTFNMIKQIQAQIEAQHKA